MISINQKNKIPFKLLKILRPTLLRSRLRRVIVPILPLGRWGLSRRRPSILIPLRLRSILRLRWIPRLRRIPITISRSSRRIPLIGRRSITGVWRLRIRGIRRLIGLRGRGRGRSYCRVLCVTRGRGKGRGLGTSRPVISRARTRLTRVNGRGLRLTHRGWRIALLRRIRLLWGVVLRGICVGVGGIGSWSSVCLGLCLWSSRWGIGTRLRGSPCGGRSAVARLWVVAVTCCCRRLTVAALGVGWVDWWLAWWILT